MRTYLLILASFVAAAVAMASTKGDVQVRRGIHEQWQTAAAGDVLKPEDSIKLEKRSSATILVDGRQKFELPGETVIDLSDLRALTGQDLLLMLAMERVRSVSGQRRDDDLAVPRTSTVHGSDRDAPPPSPLPQGPLGKLQLNGTGFLYEHGFYATCVLKSKEVFRLNPGLMKAFDARLRVASALERMDLPGEAAEEYTVLLSEQLSGAQRTAVEEKVSELRKERTK
jgi:hypothetical protein